MRNDNEALVAAIAADPAYRGLVRERARLEWTLSAVMFGAFIAFTMLIAFDKAWLARPIGDGVTSIGIPIGIGLILFAILLTAFYVRHANRRYDGAIAAIVREHSA